MSIHSLTEYRARRAAARAYHPSAATIKAVWTPADAIDTAQAFHAEIANAERGTTDSPEKPRWSSKLFGRSRFRRAAIYDGLAVTLLLALMAGLGVVVYAASAHAAPDSSVVAWTAEYGPAVCDNLDAHNSIPGLVGTALAIQDEGFTTEQSGQIISLAVIEICPRHIDLLQQFITRYGAATATA